MKLNKFKEYLYGQNFPYKLSFIDSDGRCVICFKFLKTKVLPGEKDTYCSGCDLSMTEPISWQLKVSDIMVAIDWKDISKIKKDVIFDHPSYANMNMEKKLDILNLKSCL